VRGIKPEPSPDDIALVTLGAIASAVGEPTGPPAVPLRAPSASGVPVPQRNPELAHLDLGRLRSYRKTLLGEELRVSYWRRLVQARRDLLRMGAGGDDLVDLKAALTEVRGSANRQAMLTLHPEEGMPILPHLPALWASLAEPGQQVEQLKRLSSAESVLSSYREALHKRLDRATAELVARYHEDPLLCLCALPQAPACG
jgi:hypothetical protein